MEVCEAPPRLGTNCLTPQIHFESGFSICSSKLAKVLNSSFQLIVRAEANQSVLYSFCYQSPFQKENSEIILRPETARQSAMVEATFKAKIEQALYTLSVIASESCVCHWPWCIPWNCNRYPLCPNELSFYRRSTLLLSENKSLNSGREVYLWFVLIPYIQVSRNLCCISFFWSNQRVHSEIPIRIWL